MAAREVRSILEDPETELAVAARGAEFGARLVEAQPRDVVGRALLRVRVHREAELGQRVVPAKVPQEDLAVHVRRQILETTILRQRTIEALEQRAQNGRHGCEASEVAI